MDRVMHKQRELYIDLIKIIATVFVIFNHSGLAGYGAYANESVFIKQVIELAFSIICKSAVPLFFMCSGCLLLGKSEPLAKIWKDRILKYGIVLIAFTILWYVYIAIQNHESFSIMWILRYMYSSNSFSYSGAYWYLYSYIGFLAFLPFLRLLAQSMTEKEYLYLLFIDVVVGGLLPVFEALLKLGKLAVDFSIMTNQMFIFPLLGFYLGRVCDENRLKKLKLPMGGLAIIAICCSELFTINNLKEDNLTESYMFLLGIFICIFLFISCRLFAVSWNKSNRIGVLIEEFGKCTFGVYLIHGWLLQEADAFFSANGKMVETFKISIVKVLVVYLAATGIIWVLRRNSLVRKII